MFTNSDINLSEPICADRLTQQLNARRPAVDPIFPGSESRGHIALEPAKMRTFCWHTGRATPSGKLTGYICSAIASGEQQADSRVRRHAQKSIRTAAIQIMKSV